MELEQIPLSDSGDGRDRAAAYLADALAGLYDGAPTPSPIVGGRRAALMQLQVFNAGAYQARRNDVGPSAGASRLSPYLRHGCLLLGEAKQDALEKVGGERAYKFIQELAWRQFWQLQRQRIGDPALSQDLEQPKVPLGDNPVPAEVEAGETGLVCMDTSVRSLQETGYLFNHGRLWLAAYLVHHRRCAWQAGAAFFYRSLLDGDPASNSLSWQWVASTFSHKPYFFNRDNVEKYSRDSDTGETYCTHCPAAKNNTCPFDASYETLGKRLFGANYDNDNGNAASPKSHDARGGKSGKSGKRGGDRDLAARRPFKRD